MNEFTGLSAFPLTPFKNDAVDKRAFIGLVERLAEAEVESITALGSTGSYAFLDPDERAGVARLAVEHAGTTPVFVGVGALRTSRVLANVASAEDAGARGVLLAPMTYQPLTPNDVFELFRTVTERTQLPVIVYDNPAPRTSRSPSTSTHALPSCQASRRSRYPVCRPTRWRPPRTWQRSARQFRST